MKEDCQQAGQCDTRWCRDHGYHSGMHSEGCHAECTGPVPGEKPGKR